MTAFDDHHRPARALIGDCVHCGFCLPACPTYLLWGEEMDSPRGRILLMDAAERGEVSLTPTLVGHWDACLGCMACETACPSGVRYGRLIEQTRQQVERRHRRPLRQRALRGALFAVLPHALPLRGIATALWGYRATGLQRALRSTGMATRLPEALQRADALAPVISARALVERAPRHLAATGRPRMRVAMLTGCVQRAFFGDVNAATARVLAGFGAEVVAPRQGCCGALELHVGRETGALRRARGLIDALERTGADRIAVNSAGCGSVMKEYGELLADDGVWAARAARLAARVADVSEVLCELGVPPHTLHPLPMRVAYQDACHLVHAQRVRAQPRALLAAIPGVELVALDEGDVCCGSAGVYNLLQTQAADALGERKAARIRQAAPDALVAGNPGCLTQIGAWLSRTGEPVPTFHPVELVDASLLGVVSTSLLAQRRALLTSAGHCR
ncbi:MAG TPA: heterodisulfide reductase-related iron-sulfur binding cluster [Candidatus Dormibacteraeota bacterium]